MPCLPRDSADRGASDDGTRNKRPVDSAVSGEPRGSLQPEEAERHGLTRHGARGGCMSSSSSCRNGSRARARRSASCSKGATAPARAERSRRSPRRVSPRVFRVIALPAPTEREKSQMYVQRYIPHLPAARRGRDLRSQLVQPRRRRARHGLLHRGAGALVPQGRPPLSRRRSSTPA